MPSLPLRALLPSACLLVVVASACTSLTEPNENIVVKEQRPVKVAAATETGGPKAPLVPSTQPQPRPLAVTAAPTARPAGSGAPGSDRPAATASAFVPKPIPSASAPKPKPTAKPVAKPAGDPY